MMALILIAHLIILFILILLFLIIYKPILKFILSLSQLRFISIIILQIHFLLFINISGVANMIHFNYIINRLTKLSSHVSTIEHRRKV